MTTKKPNQTVAKPLTSSTGKAQDTITIRRVSDPELFDLIKAEAHRRGITSLPNVTRLLLKERLAESP